MSLQENVTKFSLVNLNLYENKFKRGMTVFFDHYALYSENNPSFASPLFHLEHETYSGADPKQSLFLSSVFLNLFVCLRHTY